MEDGEEKQVQKCEKIWEIWKKAKLNSEKICKIQKKSNIYIGKISTTWKKDELNSEMIWKISQKYKMNSEKIVKNVENGEETRLKNVKRYGKYGRKVC